MLNQYRAQRRRGGHNPHGIGTLAIGQILYLQDFRPMGGIRGQDRYSRPICREPWIVESFANREYYPAVKGAPPVTYMLGGHLVNVRSLRTGRRQQVADWLVVRAVDCDLEINACRKNRRTGSQRAKRVSRAMARREGLQIARAA